MEFLLVQRMVPRSSRVDRSPRVLRTKWDSYLVLYPTRRGTVLCHTWGGAGTWSPSGRFATTLVFDPRLSLLDLGGTGWGRGEVSGVPVPRELLGVRGVQVPREIGGNLGRRDPRVVLDRGGLYLCPFPPRSQSPKDGGLGTVLRRP